MNHATRRRILEPRSWEPRRSKLATLGGLLESMMCALQSALSMDCPNPRFALFGLRYPRNEQTIHGLLHKAWIHALRSYIHELSESMLCAQHIHYIHTILARHNYVQCALCVHTFIVCMCAGFIHCIMRYILKRIV